MAAPGPNSGVPQLVPPPTPGSASSSSDQQTRLQILASLFPPGSQNGGYIAHLKTWEEVPGAPQNSQDSKKPRYILLAVHSDGQCKIYKSKRNQNGTFSIGKVWGLEELRALEVHKPRPISGHQNMTAPCFTITINAKSYLWETESNRQQDDFLVTLVRSFRQFTGGSAPRMIGFQVGEIPGAPAAYEVPTQGGGMATPTTGASPAMSASPPMGRRPSGRPDTAASIMSGDSSLYPARVQGQSAQMLGPSPSGTSLDPTYNPGGFAQTVGMKPSVSANSSLNAGRSPVPPSHSLPAMDRAPSPRQAPARPDSPAPLGPRQMPSQSSLKNGMTAPIASPGSFRPPLPMSASGSPAMLQQSSPPLRQQAQPLPLAAPPVQKRSTTPTGPRAVAPVTPGSVSASTAQPARKNSANVPSGPVRRGSEAVGTGYGASPLDEQTAAANAAALLGQDGAKQSDDSDGMLVNVEEMLEGLEWGRASGQGGRGSAGEIEQRLLSELSALEAAGIHAIIESDDRVNDVVKYLDNALAEVDRMDQMLTLYRTHLNAVSDDINYIESQSKGLQIQSSNQRALLAELEKNLLR